jgi:Fe-S-cluster containining protein
MTTLREGLPAVYAKLLPAFFDAPAVEEPKATCSSCAMCPPEDQVPGVTYFRPDAKCCTYQPTLPNYLVGAILADPDPALDEGRRRVRARIASRVGVTSRWLAPSRKQIAIFRSARESSFGRSTLLLCPYFGADGGCTVWRHRESVCSTFFCKYAAGADGQAFWRAVDAYLRRVERALADHAASTLAPELREPRGTRDEMSLEELEERPPSDEDYASFWGEWQGREEELYRASYDVIAGLSREVFDDLVRSEAEALDALQDAYARMRSPVLPERLILDRSRPPIPVADGVIVGTYSKYEPIKLTPALHEVLGELRSDETVAAFRERLRREHEVEVPEEMLLELYRLRVIVTP